MKMFSKHRLASLITFQLIAGAASAANIPVTLQPPEFGRPEASAPTPHDLVSRSLDGINEARINEALGALRASSAVTRGAKEAKLFREVAPSVVLIVTKDGLGSGVVISEQGLIVTNNHVISGYSEVGLIFKPKEEGAEIKKSELVLGKVEKIDQVADLALVLAARTPPGIAPILPADSDKIEIGMDVHAIGHPTGETWTYTRGFVSQLRKQYQWGSPVEKIMHVADVIQTQTPINPGNSGGPLLNDEGELLGINSFKSDGEGLNFAVAINEVRLFVAQRGDRTAPVQPTREMVRATCEPKKIFDGRNKEDDGFVVAWDRRCTGDADLVITTPDDQNAAILAYIDSRGRSMYDVWVADTDRDGKWDESVYDLDDDGKPDLIGHHPDGALKASSFETFSPDAKGKKEG